MLESQRLPTLLQQATVDQVAAASVELFSPDTMSLVALGKPGPVSEVAARRAGNPPGGFLKRSESGGGPIP